MTRRIILLLATLFAISLTSLAQAQDVKCEEATQDIFRASSVAYLDFREHIAKQNPGKTELESFLSNAENYEITVYSQGASYIVEFVPKMLNGVRLRGGAASYEVDSKTMRILKFTPTR